MLLSFGLLLFYAAAAAGWLRGASALFSYEKRDEIFFTEEICKLNPIWNGVEKHRSEKRLKNSPMDALDFSLSSGTNSTAKW